MKRLVIVTVSVLTVVALVFGVLPALAAKPSNVITFSNGFPSGMHFNLNIHGKDFCPADIDDNNSIWVPLYTEEPLPVIQYVSNRKSKGNDNPYELNVIDACTMDGDNTAKVWLPYKIRPEEGADPVDANGYFVYARILGKPNNSKNAGEPSKVILYPNFIVEAVNDGGNNNNVVPLGLITTKDIYTFDSVDQVFKRFDPPDIGTKGKKQGKSMARSITDLFMWSGWICYGGNPDTNGDGYVTVEDIPANHQYIPDLNDDGDIDLWEWQFCHTDYNGDDNVTEADIPGNAVTYLPPDIEQIEGPAANISLYEWQFYHPDFNGDGEVNQQDVDDVYDAPVGFNPETLVDPALYGEAGIIDVEDWLEYQESLGNCYHYEKPIWISNIADLVISGQPIYNDGGKLLQIRFYPVATTKITEQAHIIVKKVVTDPGSDNTTQFEFTTNYSGSFKLFNGQFMTSDGLSEGDNYTVTETGPDGWDVDIEFDELSYDSVWNPATNTATIHADPGETVTVTFKNQKQ